jgi:hypothetical protein
MGRSRREDHRPGRIGCHSHTLRVANRAITEPWGVREGRVRPGESMVEAIRDQWVIVVAVVALTVLVAWLFAGRKR